MITLQNLEDAQTIIMELTAERRAVYDDLISDNMQALAEEEMQRIKALCATINVIQVHKEYLIDSINEIERED